MNSKDADLLSQVKTTEFNFKPQDTALLHQLCIPMQWPIVKIQQYCIIIPTNIIGTGTLDHCIVDQFYWQQLSPEQIKRSGGISMRQLRGFPGLVFKQFHVTKISSKNYGFNQPVLLPNCLLTHHHWSCDLGMRMRPSVALTLVKFFDLLCCCFLILIF